MKKLENKIIEIFWKFEAEKSLRGIETFRDWKSNLDKDEDMWIRMISILRKNVNAMKILNKLI
jgi:hypothetical protein